MRVQNNTVMFLMIVSLTILTMTLADLFAACDQPDAPDCTCFDDSNAWDPSGAYIQDVAIQTVGTKESCACPGTPSCDWEIGPDDPFSNAGKPYYQMVLGCNSEAAASLVATLLSWPWPWTPVFEEREAWCSEAISYWHREAAIPYSVGYMICGWHCDWLNQNVGELKTWYTTEEDGGRGRWIEPEDVDYDDYVLGVTLPVPGSYVAWRTFDDYNDTWISDGESHSLMINEMWIHSDVLGKAFQVKVSLLEGNSGNRVKNEREWDDILSFTPQGSDWINGNKKIYGFGVDLGSDRQLIYDESRLHIVTWPYVTPPPTRVVKTLDPIWTQHYEPYIPRLRAYAKLLRQAGGEPNVVSSSPALKISGIPDGQQVYWLFPKGLPARIQVLIDLLDVHPRPVKGMELKWDTDALPPDYRVQFADADQEYQEAIVPQMPDPGKLPPEQSLPVPAIFATSGDGVPVRYVKLMFPYAFEQNAVLQELRFRYYQGPLADSEVCSYRLMGDLDNNCRVDFRDVALMAGNWLVDCMVNPDDPACMPE